MSWDLYCGINLTLKLKFDADKDPFKIFYIRCSDIDRNVAYKFTYQIYI